MLLIPALGVSPAEAKRPVRPPKTTTTTVPATTTTVPATTTTTTPTTNPTPGAPTSPPAPICGSSVLNGPATPPVGAVRIDPGVNVALATDAHPAGTTFWLAPGVHTLGPTRYWQVVPKNGNSYVGGPGAVLDGQFLNNYAFTQKASGVTIKHLTVTRFTAPGNEGVVNHDFGAGWTIEYNTIEKNGGAGVMLGDNNRLAYNCLVDNGQYGFQGFGKNLIIDHNEIARNNTFDWETNSPGGCGCSGGSKFWSSGPGEVTNNWVHDNMNVGLWWDNNNVGYLIEGNLIEGNRSHGIMYETSYNARIVNNTLRRNAIPFGQSFQARGDAFPVGAIYLSEAGGESRVSSRFPVMEVSGNLFEDNWGGVVAWENADRFGNDNSANTSKGYTTLLVDPSGAAPSTQMGKCGDPATGGLINTQPYRSDCRWRTVNLLITNNDFKSNKAVIGCTSMFCNQQALISNWGTVPAWSPYLARTVQNDITFNQNNRWSNNRYVGEWHFTPWEPKNFLAPAGWQSAPYNQDAGSTFTNP